MGVGHLEGTPEEGIVEPQDHLRHPLLILLLVNVAQELEDEGMWPIACGKMLAVAGN